MLRKFAFSPNCVSASRMKLQISECLDVGAELVQSLCQVLVAAVDIVDIAEDGRTLRREHTDKDNDRRSKSRRAHHLRCLELCRTLHIKTMRINKKRLGTKLVQLFVIDRSLFIDPVVDHRLSFHLSGDDRKNGMVFLIVAG